MAIAVANNPSRYAETVQNRYTVIIHPCVDTTGYYAVCDMPDGGATTQGETLWQTKMNMFEAMSLYLEDYPEIEDYDLTFEVLHA